ncbi:addiction module protein [Marinicella rhabdoformis]|uniref:addiction module protein n=1 Tax=Marinicella rhabdoformis TaxID=2580566 RepID=UPI0012AEC16B|nr:addiction module protein [Marinicella rhabdoformis]
MSNALKIVLENIENMSSSEKALAAHCILSALDKNDNEDIDSEWLAVIESRRAQYKSGTVKLSGWDEMKKRILE